MFNEIEKNSSMNLKRKTPNPNRPWCQFNLRTFLVSAVLVGVLSATVGPVAVRTVSEWLDAPPPKSAATPPVIVYHRDFLLGDPLFSDSDENGTTPRIKLLRRGNKQYRAGRLDDALFVWQQIINGDDNTPAWNMAVLNSGRALQRRGEFAEAITVLTKLLESRNFGERNKSRWEDGLDPMEVYLRSWNNDWHDASGIISECYESLGNIQSAHQFAIASRDEYPHSAMCGNAWASQKMAVDERIADLAARVHHERDIGRISSTISFPLHHAIPNPNPAYPGASGTRYSVSSLAVESERVLSDSSKACRSGVSLGHGGSLNIHIPRSSTPNGCPLCSPPSD